MALLYTLFWQLKRSIKTMHFNPLFFIIGQLIWPLFLLGTFYLGYTPLMDDKNSLLKLLTDSNSLWNYLLPGIIVTSLFMEYVNLGSHLSMDRDYGILEPIYISPVNRILWLVGNTTSVIPSGIISTIGFILSSHLIFNIPIPHPFYLFIALLFILISSLPWGAMVCSIFLSGRNQRVLYSIFETPAEFLSGVRFPITALPMVLSSLAVIFPLSHCVKILRFVFMNNIPWDKVFRESITLILLSFCYLFVAIILFNRAEERGKQQGTLTFT